MKNSDEQNSASRKLWHAGTLTYTFGGLMLLFVWLLWGDFAWSMRDRAIGPAATIIIKNIGVSEFLYGLIIIGFPNFTNIFLSPVISYISDRHRGRLGRRIPFLLFTTPFIVFGLCTLGATYVLGAWLHRLIPAISLHTAQLTVFAVAWVSLDFGNTLASSLFNALVNDVVPRELLGRFFAVFRIVSLLAGMYFNFVLLAKVEVNPLWIFLAIGLLYGIGLLTLCLNVKEGEYPPLPRQEENSATGRPVFLKVWGSLLTYLRQSFSIPHYCWYMLAMALAAVAFMPINSFSIQYAQSLNIPMSLYGKYLTASYAGSLIISFPLGMLADRFHPLRTGIISLLIYLALMVSGWFAMINPGNFAVIFILHTIISGCYFTLTASLGTRMLPQALFAQFTSAAGIVAAIMNMVTGPAIGRSIDLLNYNYRCIFLIGAGLTLVTLLLLHQVYRGYKRYGGDSGYIPPMPG